MQTQCKHIIDAWIASNPFLPSLFSRNCDGNFLPTQNESTTNPFGVYRETTRGGFSWLKQQEATKQQQNCYFTRTIRHSPLCQWRFIPKCLATFFCHSMRTEKGEEKRLILLTARFCFAFMIFAYADLYIDETWEEITAQVTGLRALHCLEVSLPMNETQVIWGSTIHRSIH